MPDLGASVLAKLRNKAKSNNKNYQLCMQLFCQEEFLRRVAVSKYAENLVLKGGLFVYTLTNFESRATVDIDFLLTNMPNTPEQVENMTKEIVSTSTGNDFIEFEVVKAQKIALQKQYNGISIGVIAKINNTKTPFHIDFGIGDVIVPKQEKRTLPVQLDGFEAPVINTYSIESTIAEKFDAIISMLEFTSRMKDYYDIYYLANSFCFDGRKLQEAIIQTLQNRGTSYEKDTLSNVLNFVDDDDMNKKWIAFLKRTQLIDIAFIDVITTMDKFLTTIYECIVKENEFFGEWKCETQNWIVGGKENG